MYILQFVNIKLKLCNTATNQNYTTTGIFESDRGVLLTTVVLGLQLSMLTVHGKNSILYKPYTVVFGVHDTTIPILRFHDITDTIYCRVWSSRYTHPLTNLFDLFDLLSSFFVKGRG